MKEKKYNIGSAYPKSIKNIYSRVSNGIFYKANVIPVRVEARFDRNVSRIVDLRFGGML